MSRLTYAPCAFWFILFALLSVSFFSSSWCRRVTAACDCDTPWIFYVTFLPKLLVCCFVLSFFETKPVLMNHNGLLGIAKKQFGKKWNCDILPLHAKYTLLLYVKWLTRRMFGTPIMTAALQWGYFLISKSIQWGQKKRYKWGRFLCTINLSSHL